MNFNLRTALLGSCLLFRLIFIDFANGQNWPERSLFSIRFENTFEDDPLGVYSDATYRSDWNSIVGTLEPTASLEVIAENDSYYKKFLRGYLEKGKYQPAYHGWYWDSNIPQPTTELYFSYDVRFKPGFEWVLGGKIPGIGGGKLVSGVIPSTTDGFSTRLMWKENGRLVFYVYHQNQDYIYGNTYFWGNFAFTAGKWYNITIRVVLNSVNSGIASSNGILEGFVDGRLLFQKKDFKFRSIDNILIDKMIISSFFGGNTPEWASIRDEWIDMDNFIVFSYSNSLTTVPRGFQTSSVSKELIHPLRVVPDNDWKKSMQSSNVSLSEITVNWADYPVPVSYILERKEAGSSEFIRVGSFSYGTKSFSDKELKTDKAYIYRLKAGSVISNELNVSTKAPIVPNIPGSLKTTNITKSSISLSWVDNSSNESGFSIERSTSAETGFSEIKKTVSDITGYTDISLQPATTYYYRMRAYNNDGTSSFTPVISATTIQLDLPDPPSNLIASKIDYTLATIIWKDNSDNEKGFELERYGPGDMTIKTIISLGSNITSYTDRELKMDGIYRYRIRSVNDDGKSAWSNTIELVTPLMLRPVAPTQLKSTNFTDKSISVTWDDNSDNEDNFILTRKLAIDTSSVVNITLSPNDTAYTDSSLTSSTTYLYTIQAVNLAGYSNSSNKNVATTLSESELKRVKNGLIAYYNFGFNNDYVICDQSGYEDPLNLLVLDRSSIIWNEKNALDILGNTAIVSMAPAEKIINACKNSNEITFECWIKPQQPIESYSVSRIVSLGMDDGDLGFLIDQKMQDDIFSQKLNYSIRLQTSSTLCSGYPEYIPKTDISYLNMEHLVYTRNRTGTETFYLNGLPSATGFRPDNFDTWKNNYYLRLGNESDMIHPWKGSFFIVAIYNKCLNPDEILTNYNAGACDKIVKEEIPYSISASPNPADDNTLITITPERLSDYTNPVSFSIINSFGQSIYQQLLFNPSSQFVKSIDLSHYSPGVYLIRLNVGEHQKLIKLIKE